MTTPTNINVTGLRLVRRACLAHAYQREEAAVIQLLEPVLNAGVCRRLKKQVKATFSLHSTTLIDFGMVKTIDASALAAAWDWIVAAEKAGATLEFVNCGKAVNALLALVRIPKAIPTSSSLEEALASKRLPADREALCASA